MKAVVYEKYGPPEVLTFRDVPKPAPKDDEVLVRNHATSVTVADYRARSLDLPPGFGPVAPLFFGVFGPRNKVLGSEFSGVVEAVGSAVSRFKPGDDVFGCRGLTYGAYAEYHCVKETSAIALKPANLDFTQAAALAFGGETALYFLGKAKLKTGETALINGASGAVGSALVQMLSREGVEVTGVCSAGNAELVRQLGATHTIDYATTDFATAGKRYDAIFDCVVNAPFARAEPALNDNGRHVAVVASLGEMLAGMFRRPKRGITLIGGGFAVSQERMNQLAEMAANGSYEPLIDRVYLFEQIVEAHRYVDTGRKRGNVVVTIAV